MAPNADVREPLFLTELHIDGFRGLSVVTLDRLAQFNLLVGNNNSGKTSILEAAAIYAAPLDMVEWANIARTREARSVRLTGETLSGIDAIRWMFPHVSGSDGDQDEHRPISLFGDGRIPTRRLQATCSRLRGIPPEDARRRMFLGRTRQPPVPALEETTEDEGWLISLQYDEEDGTFFIPHALEFPLWSSLGLRYAPRPRGRRPFVELLAPYAHRNEALGLQLLTDAIRDASKGSVAELLNSLDGDIIDVEIIATEDGRRPAIAVRHRRSGVVPISVLGDGVRRALSIALSVRKARNGLLLIDELEAALHVSALHRLYPWLLNSCRRHNVQLMATTHSLETIDVIAKVSGDDDLDVAAFHLSGDQRAGTPKRYSGGMLRRLVHEQGLDVR